MSIYDLQTESGRVAYRFLRWQPPMAIEAALIKLNQMDHKDDKSKDQALVRLTECWKVDGAYVRLSDFRHDPPRAVQILMEHQLRGHLVVTEKFSSGFVTVIYSDQQSTEVVGSGNGMTETESLFDATLSFLEQQKSHARHQA